MKKALTILALALSLSAQPVFANVSHGEIVCRTFKSIKTFAIADEIFDHKMKFNLLKSKKCIKLKHGFHYNVLHVNNEDFAKIRVHIPGKSIIAYTTIGEINK